jgi:hypothetical protein
VSGLVARGVAAGVHDRHVDPQVPGGRHGDLHDGALDEHLGAAHVELLDDVLDLRDHAALGPHHNGVQRLVGLNGRFLGAFFPVVIDDAVQHLGNRGCITVAQIEDPGRSSA